MSFGPGELFILFVLIGVVVLGVAVWPTPPVRPPAPNPCATPDEAFARLDAARAQDDTPAVNPAMRYTAFTHGGPTDTVVLILHGYTNGPRQFYELGRRLHAAGATVLIPRAPYHGYKDRLTTAHADFTAETALHWANAGLDVACALGRQVVVCGISGGGAAAAWLAQNRREVHRAVLLAPLIGLYGPPLWAMRLVSHLMCRLPNQLRWWNEAEKEGRTGPPHAYPRFATRAIGHLMRLGYSVFDAALRTAPHAKSLFIVTTVLDTGVSNPLSAELARRWRAHPGVSVSEYQFPPDSGLQHDFIDPTQPYARPDVVYPLLQSMLLAEIRRPAG